LFPVGENVFMSGKLSVEVEAAIFDIIGLRKLNIIDFNRWAGWTPRIEGDMCRIGFIDFHPLSFEAVLNV
jgi:hypothetical protein